MLVAVTVATNIVYALWLRHHVDDAGTRNFSLDHSDKADAHQVIAFTFMLLDLATLTTMLHFSGGASNPFSFFYFVNLAVGGVMLRRQAAWILAVSAMIGYAALLTLSPTVDGISSQVTIGIPLQSLDFRSLGLMFAFSACATVITYFVTRTAGELRQSQKQLLATQAARADSHRLEGLTTLAAGAAHELATPLSTIDVIVRELTRHLEGCDKPESVNTDLKLIDGQLEMCRQILQRMRSAAGDSMAQQWSETTVGDLIDAILEGIRDPHRVDVPEECESVESQTLWVPQEAIAQAVRNLIHNGLDASGHSGRVQLFPKIIQDELQLTVIDTGEGMSNEVLDRASDPFFTTKEPGRGIGLGLFLTRNVISQLGGVLRLESSPGVGTQAIVTIPMKHPDRSDGTV